MRVISLLALLTTGLLLGSWSPNPRPADGDFRWYTMEEVIEIKQNNPDDDKAVFIDVYTDWCGWCKRMDATTFSDSKVQAILQAEFYPVKFNGEAKRDIQFGEQTFTFVAEGRRGYHELAAALLQGRLSYPTVVLMDADFNMIQPIPGYRTAPELLPILHFIGTEAYQSGDWESYLAEWQAARQP